MADFYIFRHGQSSYNLIGRTQGQTNDSVLTELGERQAAAIGEKLADKGIELIVTSPLRRARQTAALANQVLNVPVVVDERFTEVDVGEVEGWMREDIRGKYPELFEVWHQPGIDTVCYPGGETRRQVRERVFAGLNDWAAKSEYKTIAVSSHGIMLGQILIALGQEDSGNLPNGAVLHICRRDNQWQIVEPLF